jgi:excisionase family DNA binding protein
MKKQRGRPPKAKEKVEMLELPKKELMRIDEVASYFDVSERAIRLWIAHGHLEAEKLAGSIRIVRGSVLKFRLASRIQGGTR